MFRGHAAAGGGMRVLVVEDQATLREAILESLAILGVALEGCATGAEARAAFSREPADLVLTDLRLEAPEMGLELVRAFRGERPTTEVLLMTAYGTVEVAVAAMKAGAFDFLVKPFTLDHLLEKARRVLGILLERRRAATDRARAEILTEETLERWGGGEMVGRSSGMLELFRLIDKVAESSSAVLLLGESGTGKELAARAIHERSPRRDGTFVRVNCGALAEGVLESELFGHEQGAFTDARRQRRGRFELADGGTLLLDEIGEVSTAMQVKLLRVLQEKQFERVGGEETVQVDVRILAATNRDLEKEVREGRFRQDLFYRLHVIPIRIPPLRDRAEDIPLLAEHFVVRHTRELGRSGVRLTSEALQLLTRYRWPGNVRELENVLERAVVLCEGDVIRASDLPFGAHEAELRVELPGGHPPLREVVEQVERQLIERALKAADGVKTEAARLLDLKPSVLYYKLEKYGLLDRIRE